MTGYRASTWITEERTWMIRCFTAYLYANVNTIMDKIGLRKASFLPTNKAVNDAAADLYQRGAGKGNGMMLIERLIPVFGMMLHLPLLQGMVVRKDKGRVPTNVSIVSLLLSSILMAYASFAT
ncbi:hypothetical protein SASPL_116818 [Salvia splendens]|uniref:Uncharacterized protein n=1 Tax=Salvia splendens TaxID=180675 RepID=A0A8X8XWS8_SALSN|nr:hypothetical protein SASPL_116818 [Salvia splendens]